ncbi:MAG: ABC transporter ATP-binding protein [Butyrivibrio sp.]
MNNVLELHNVTKDYGDFKLDNVSLTVGQGGICGFIGQNGAGKTTTIKLIMNVIKRDTGEIKVFGQSIDTDSKKTKERIGIVYDEMGFHDFLTPKQLNTILKNIYSNWDETAFYTYLKRFSLPSGKKCGDFSRGMRMKLQIAAAMSHNADLLIMDEPTSGLDPIVRTEILQIFQEYVTDENHTILLSSHITGDLDRIADEVIFINGGKIILSGNKDELLMKYGIIKCAKESVDKIDKKDIVSVRSSAFCEEVMVSDRSKYADFPMEPATLEEILIFNVMGKTDGVM